MPKTNLKQRRLELGLTMKEIATAVGVSESTVSRWEAGNIANMKKNRLVALANILQIPVSNLIDDDSNNNEPTLTARDEKDIKKKLDEALASIDSEALMFDGEPVEMDKETKELLKASLENSIRLAKTLAKKKYTPKKYKKNDKSDD